MYNFTVVVFGRKYGLRIVTDSEAVWHWGIDRGIAYLGKLDIFFGYKLHCCAICDT